MTIRKNYLMTVVGSFAAILSAVTVVHGADVTPPVGVGLAVDSTNSLMPGKLVFLQSRSGSSVVNDNIAMTVSLGSLLPGGFVTTQGFKDAPFHLLLVFTGPSGNMIRSNEFQNTPWADPPSPRVIPVGGNLEQVEAVETVPGDWTLTITIPNVNSYYDLHKPGRYSVQVVFPVPTYGSIFKVEGGVSYALLSDRVWEGSVQSNVEYFTLTADLDGDGYFAPEACARTVVNNVASLVCTEDRKRVDCNDNDNNIHPSAPEPIPWDGVDHDCDPATPGVPVTPSGKIVIQAVKHVVGAGDHPSCRKEPIANMPLRIVEKNKQTCGSYGESWRYFPDIWFNCPAVATGYTDAQGTASFSVPEGHYMVVGLYDPDPAKAGDEIFAGKSIGELEVNHTKRKKLNVIVTSDGKSRPGKSREKEDTELEVIEPEYLDWTGLRALFPVIYDGEGDLKASTSIHLPQGFTADRESLSVEGSQATRAIQFTVTGSAAAVAAGSDQKEIPLEHKFQHRKRAGVLKSTINKND